MAVKYDFKKNPFAKEGDERILYLGIVVSGTKDTDDIVAEIADHTSFSEGCVQGVMKELSNYIVRYLKQGYNVKINDLGSFSVTLTSRPVTDKSEIRAASIDFDKVNFRPTPDLIKRIRYQAHFERAKYGFRNSSQKYTKEERLQILRAYLKEHESISRLEYSNLTGVLRSTAARDLEAWENEKLIIRLGRYVHARFTWKKEI